MNQTELAIIEQMAKLDENEQQQILELALQLVNEKLRTPISLGEWLEQATAFREELRRKYGDQHQVGSQGLLDELREEASWPRW